jgi:hypothetical protein
LLQNNPDNSNAATEAPLSTKWRGAGGEEIVPNVTGTKVLFNIW